MMHKMTPHVTRLPCHLPNEQQVYLRETEDPQEALEKKNKTELTEWFKLNQTDEEARQHLYVDIAKHYVWDKKEQTFKKRKQNRASRFNDNDGAMSDTISRIPYII